MAASPQSDTKNIRYVRHIGSPYSGRLAAILGRCPGFLRTFVIEAGGIGGLLGRIVWSAIRHPTGYWSSVFDEMYQSLRRSFVALTVSIFGFMMFTSLLAVIFFKMLGAEQLFGPMMMLQSMRSWMLWVDSMVVAGVIGAALTSDLGARKVREELEAMEVMGIDPVRELAVPRIVSITLTTTMISVPSMLVSNLAILMGAEYVAHLSAADFYSNVYSNVGITDVFSVIVYCTIVGLLIGSICCYKGFEAAGGAIGLGRAVNQGVVISFVAIWILLLVYQAIAMGLFPEAGEFR